MRGSLGTVLLVGAAMFVGCKSNGDPEVSVNQENLCEEVAEVACHDMWSCCAEGEIESILNVDEPRTEGQCREDVQVLCERGLAQRQFSVDNGRARFEASAAEACLEGLVVGDECAVFATAVPWAEECVNELWVGLVADGGACFYGYECAGADSFCGPNRVCTPLPGDGQLCPQQDCATGLFCNAGTCRPLRAATEACTRNDMCQAGLFCNFDAEPEPVCAPLRAIGEACGASSHCTSAFCVPGICAGANRQTCFEDATCNGACADDGSFCTTASQCGQGTCSVGMNVCSSNLQCVAGGGDVCNFPVACNPPNCVGDPVCGENFFATDFCEDAISSLPVSILGDRLDPL
jgi:hypothetical protein